MAANNSLCAMAELSVFLLSLDAYLQFRSDMLKKMSLDEFCKTMTDEKIKDFLKKVFKDYLEKKGL